MNIKNIKIGEGFDVHRLCENRRLVLGGAEIPYTLGLDGHSDADVLVHAIMDSMLGALALGDIGQHFPDSDVKYKNADSIKLLQAVCRLITEKGYRIGNLDCTVSAQQPKLAPYILNMRKNIAAAIGTSAENVSVKATTTERLGFEGRGEGISARAVCLLFCE